MHGLHVKLPFLKLLCSSYSKITKCGLHAKSALACPDITSKYEAQFLLQLSQRYDRGVEKCQCKL